jgi:chromosome partitioning protein
MRRVIVINAKGGCGKTTVATNLASSYAIRGFRTALIDYDPQGSSMQWLRARNPALPAIQGVALHDASRVPLAGAWQLRVPRDTQRVVVDTPAGLRAIDLAGRVTADDMLLVPIQPSAIDVRATADFIRDLLLTARLRPQERRLALLVNRMRRGSSLGPLQAFLASLQIPVLEQLREAQVYLSAAEHGLGVCELPPLSSRPHRNTWQTVLNWLEGGTAPLPLAPEAADAQAPKPSAAVPAFLAPDSGAPKPPVPPKDLN